MKKLFVVLIVIGLIVLGWFGWQKINHPIIEDYGCYDENGHCEIEPPCNPVWNPQTSTFDKPLGCN